MLIFKGAHLASATVSWHWLFFCRASKVRAYFGRPVTRRSQIPEVALVDFAPMGALAYFSVMFAYFSILKISKNTTFTEIIAPNK